jgi:protein tyrosine phosphatase (PTP) superfamily phosphohydrolase (DUF442 family)
MRAHAMRAGLLLAVVAAASAGFSACTDVRASRAPAQPLAFDEGTAYERARAISLPERLASEPTGLHNVYPLSASIISGGQPHDRAALAAIAAMGVKTILSVDGKTPDAEGASELGMRYVHVPVQYRGITQDELLKISKTFREAEGPFYVHCFHGQHRGPAAAAIGRLVLDGASREQALAEMRQWCGTSEKYEGLYRAVAASPMPTEAQTGAFDWQLTAAQQSKGLRDLMIRISRHFDNIEGMAKRAWTVNPDHPDVDPANESAILRNLFEQARELPEVQEHAVDFRDRLSNAIKQSTELREAYTSQRATQSSDSSQSTAAFAALEASCTGCHAAYRND